MAPTQARLKELIHYNPETGVWTWLQSGKGRRSLIAGSRSKRSGRREICIDYKRYQAYHLAFLYMTGEMPADEVDHRDKNCTNDSWENLREATRLQNGANRSLNKNNTSGVTGVTWDRKNQKWRSSLVTNGVYVSLGRHTDLDVACAVRQEAAERLFGEFAP